MFLSLIMFLYTANSVWAGGEFFDMDYDYPYSIDSTDPDALLTPRWYSAWLLLSAFIPITIMYALWGYYTYNGMCSMPEHEEDIECHTPDDLCRACHYDHTPGNPPVAHSLIFTLTSIPFLHTQ